MCQKTYYRGLEIDHNISQFGSPYFTIVNQRVRLHNNKNPHVHVMNMGLAKDVIDAFLDIKFKGCSKHKRLVKNKAWKLFTNQEIHMANKKH